MKTIQLTRGKVALVDDEDFALVSRFRWRAVFKDRSWYALTDVGGRANKRGLYMHRLIMGAGRAAEIDHRSGDGLDNQRANLRDATSRQNKRNRVHLRAGKTSRFLGVCWDKRIKRWRAAIHAGPVGASGKCAKIYLGLHLTEEAAARAYDAAARVHFGEFARLNLEPGRAA